MKVIAARDGYAEVELTRRNLEALILKLNAGPGASACTIDKHDDAGVIRVRAVENDKHYHDREPGLILDPVSGELF